MLQTIYTGMHGMVSQQLNIDAIANNVANVNTTGYKTTRVDFRDALYQTMISPTENGPEINLRRGAGVLVYQNIRDYRQGARLETERALDFALEGPGFFRVEDLNGEILYTRGGSYYLSVEGGGDYLVDAQGRYLLDTNGARIRVQGVAANMQLSQDGALTYAMQDGTLVNAGVRLGLFAFDNRNGLTARGDGYFSPSENSGQPRPSAGTEVWQGCLEASNVDYSYEVTRLIRAQRAYQLASRCVTTADQMAGIVNTIRT
ncbi:MAG: flagellar hook-basal body protein [Oscillospiraceae bacterium]|nr:flagellar hook-basal body protein [Oscillospiraceae bacterium]